MNYVEAIADVGYEYEEPLSSSGSASTSVHRVRKEGRLLVFKTPVVEDSKKEIKWQAEHIVRDYHISLILRGLPGVVTSHALYNRQGLLISEESREYAPKTPGSFDTFLVKDYIGGNLVRPGETVPLGENYENRKRLVGVVDRLHHEGYAGLDLLARNGQANMILDNQGLVWMFDFGSPVSVSGRGFPGDDECVSSDVWKRLRVRDENDLSRVCPLD